MLLVFCLLTAVLALLSSSVASASERENLRPVIILVSGGSLDPNDLRPLMGLEKRVKQAFPCYEVELAFTSPEIRDAWAERGRDPNFKKHFPWVEERFYRVKNALSCLAQVQETGPRLCLVQPLELIDGQSYHDIVNIVDALRKIKAFDRNDVPFPYIGLGNPAMGFGDGQKENLFQTAGVFKPLFNAAKESNASVVLITDSRGEANTLVYRSFADVLQLVYDPKVFIGMPHPKFGSKFVLEDMEKDAPPPANLMLASLSFFLSDQIKDDLFGSGDGSWASSFAAKGYSVIPYQGSLCGSDVYADLFINSLKKMEETVSRRYTD